jgi:hypothetical protein
LEQAADDGPALFRRTEFDFQKGEQQWRLKEKS